MFFEPYIILIVLVCTMALFIWGRWRYDIVALIALCVSVAVGAVPFSQVYSGLANNAVITVACVMVISQTITRSGILSHLIKRIGSVTHQPILHLTSLTIITAILSAFMNNVGALALMMPVAIQTSTDANRSPSQVLMPIALGSALGGLCTVIGTPPNLLISSYRQELTGRPFNMFDFGHVGLLIAIIGILFIVLIGWRLIPRKRNAPKDAEDLFQIQDYITEVKIPENSSAVNITVSELEETINADFVIIGLIRNNRKRLVLVPEQILKENDILIIEASPKDLDKLLQEAKLQLASEKISPKMLKSKDVSLLEAVVPQGSRIEGQSSHSMRLRSRFHVNLLAIAREGQPYKQRLSKIKLQAGDVVLLQGSDDTLRANASSLGFLPLVERGLNVGKKTKAYLPIIIFIIAIILAALQLLPVEVAFGGAVLAMILFNTIPVRQVYESVDWPIIILLAAMIPIGSALQTTGGTGIIAHYIIMISGQLSPIYVLAILLIVTMTLSDFMNNAATTVVMAPIAVSIAKALQVHIDPFLMTVAIGASCSFLTPVGHQNNTLVMGPGGYKFSDYIRLGLPLEVLIIAVTLPLILWAWPLK